MASNIINWTSSGTYTTLVTSSELTGLSTGGRAIGGTAITNNKDQYAHVEIQMLATGALVSGDYLAVYFLSAADNTNYEDGSASITPARAADVIIPLRAVTNTSQRVNIRSYLPAGSFKTLVINNASGAFDTTSNVLSYRPYDDQISTA